MKEYQDAEYLRRKYIDEGLSCRQVARICDCSAMTVLRALRCAGIETRSQESGYRMRLRREKRRARNAPAPSNWTQQDQETLEELMELLGYEQD